MEASDFVYTKVFKGALAAGARESQARNSAVIAMQKYKNNQFKTTAKLIAESIKDAKAGRC